MIVEGQLTFKIQRRGNIAVAQRQAFRFGDNLSLARGGGQQCL
ncbi:Uncharacterised protein [Enterobacter cloacae]|nr:Uncharacterised protein [Enterobacter cloacae]